MTKLKCAAPSCNIQLKLHRYTDYLIATAMTLIHIATNTIEAFNDLIQIIGHTRKQDQSISLKTPILMETVKAYQMR